MKSVCEIRGLWTASRNAVNCYSTSLLLWHKFSWGRINQQSTASFFLPTIVPCERSNAKSPRTSIKIRFQGELSCRIIETESRNNTKLERNYAYLTPRKMSGTSFRALLWAFEAQSSPSTGSERMRTRAICGSLRSGKHCALIPAGVGRHFPAGMWIFLLLRSGSRLHQELRVQLRAEVRIPSRGIVCTSLLSAPPPSLLVATILFSLYFFRRISFLRRRSMEMRAIASRGVSRN